MKCPYCNRTVRDMPDHLKDNQVCLMQHVDKLREDMEYVLKVTIPKHKITFKGMACEYE